ncbi:MAG: hypothetical protein GEU73_12210 [Chloroflexi bacterium]|nr:hypothetical protein [Chloroflexota bacterium]
MGRMLRATLAAVVVFIGIVLIIVAIATEQAGRSEPVLLDVGAEGVINVANAGMGVTPEDYDALLHATAADVREGIPGRLAAGEPHELRDLRSAGKVYVLPKGTRVLALEHLVSQHPWASMRIRVLGGPHAGTEGWVAYDHVSPSAP